MLKQTVTAMATVSLLTVALVAQERANRLATPPQPAA